MTITSLRRLCLIEGLSLVVLVCVAVPLKHVWDMPLAVRYVGMIHGVLWLVLLAVLFVVARRHLWSLGRSTAVFASSIIPFGFLLVDRRMRTWEHQAESRA